MVLRSGSDNKSHPNAVAKRPRLWMNIVFVLVIGGILAVVAAVGVENHQDKVLTVQMINTEAELRMAGGRIADIKDHRFTTMNEYVNAYAQIEPLLSDYYHKLQEYSDLCSRAQQREETQSLIDILRLQGRHKPKKWRNPKEMIEIIRQINATMKREAAVIRDMSALPQQDQLQFWHEEFTPLLAQEHALREQLLLAGQRMSPQPTLQ
jgi:hypothetical protein